VGVLSAASGITTFLSCTVSGWLAERLSGLRWETPGLTVVNYQVLFVLTGLLRIPALFLLRRIQEPEAWRTSRVIRKALIEFNRRMGLLRYLFPYR
jgi:MFS family permease